MPATLRRIVLLALLVAVGLVAQLGLSALPVAADPPPCADLVVTQFEIQPISPDWQIVEDRNARISITVLNQGTCPSLSFVVQWKRDKFASDGPSTYVDGLNANQSHTVTFDYQFPKAGNFTTVAEVDTDHTVDETNESNNLAIQDVTVLENKPDLVITSFSIVPASPVKGQNTQINLRVKNQGTLDAGPFVVQWKQNANAASGPSTQIDQLAAGASRDIVFTFAFNDAGDFTTVATVDTDHSVAEWNEDNNLAILAVSVLPALPDLVVTDFVIEPVNPADNFPPLPVEGLNARIKITVLNQGNLDAGSFIVQWKSAMNAPTGPTAHVQSLAAGASTVLIFEYAFPNKGNFTTVATLDTGSSVLESNEDNNIAIKSTTVQEAVIDLVLTKLDVNPALGVPASIPPQPVQGRLSRAIVMVENRGNFPAGDFVVAWFPTLSLPDLSKQVNGLGYDESVTLTFDFTYPQAGTFTTKAVADSTNRVRESNESNNSMTRPVIVEPQLPDMEILSFKITPESPVRGTAAKATIIIRNRGNSPAGPFTVQWKPTPFSQDLSKQVNGMFVHQIVVVQFDYTFPLAGQFASTVTLDPTNRVEELRENNNKATKQVTVQQATRDLIITEMRIAEGTCVIQEDVAAALVEPIIQQGAPIKVCITVQNLGNSAMGPFVVRWNPDAFGLSTPSLNSLVQQVDTLGAGQEKLITFDFNYPKAGNYRTVGEVDAFKNVTEVNEDNNLAILNVVVVATGPDLIITEMTISPGFANGGDEKNPPPVPTCVRINRDSAIPPGTPLEEPKLIQGFNNRVCIIVKNEGNRPAGPFLVEWNPDAFGLITPSLSTVSQQIDSLAPGESKKVEFDFIWDKAGEYHTIAKADAFNDVKELDENDNLRIVDVVVFEAGPDIEITRLTIAQGNRSCTEVPGPAAGDASVDVLEPTIQQGVEATICIVVRNNNFEPAGAFLVEWNPDAFGIMTPGPATLSTQVNGLTAYETKTVKFLFTYHEHGEFRSVAKADPFNNVAEVNEANNEAILNVIVTPASIDLVVSAFTIAPKEGTDIIRGSKAVATITVKNNGSYPTGAFYTQWQITGAGTGGPSMKIDGLQPLGQAGDSRTFTLEGSFFKAGPYTSVAEVDIYDQVIETNETNNTRTASVDVKPRQTQLRVTMNTVHVNTAFTDGIDGNAEWVMLFGVLDSQNPDGFQSAKAEDGAVENGDNLGVNKSFTLTLIESAPLVFGMAAFEVDDFLGIPYDGKFLGFTAQLWTAVDRWGAGTFTIPTIPNDSDPCANGCYTLNYTVTVLSEPPALAAEAAAAAEETPEVVLPHGLGLWFPEGAKLPDGVRRADYRYFPAMK